MTAATAIHDRAPPPGGKKPDPGPAEHAVCRAALAFAGADRRLREHRGARSGEDYDANVAAWRDAYQALLAAATKYEGGSHAGNEA
jgi:hypothetical protein